jgi:hypothetical protein
MDPRDRADALLARARSRGAHVVTPDNMTSPMDSTATQQIPRAMMDAMDQRELDPETTMVLSAEAIAGYPPQPPQQQQRPQPPQQQAPPPDQQRVNPGPVPTIQQVPGGRPSLSQRLSGDV